MSVCHNTTQNMWMKKIHRTPEILRLLIRSDRNQSKTDATKVQIIITSWTKKGKHKTFGVWVLEKKDK